MAFIWADIDLRKQDVVVTGTLVGDSSQPKGQQWVKGPPKTRASAGKVPTDADRTKRLAKSERWRESESDMAPH